jgi:hypothetical protein
MAAHLSDRKLIIPALYALMAASLVFLAAYGFYVVTEHKRFGGDFISFWTRAEQAAHGQAAAIYDMALLEDIIAHPQNFQAITDPLLFFPYPPNSLLFLWPLGLMPYPLAVAAWLLTGWFFYLFAIVRSPPWPLLAAAAGKGDMRVIAAFLALSPFVFANVMTGHAGFLLAGFLFLGFALLDAKPKLAGLCFSVLLFKPQLALLLPVALLAGRYWTAMLWAALGVALQIALTALLWGTSIWPDYAHYLSLFPAALEHTSQILNGLKISAYRSLTHLGVSAGVAGMVQGVCFLAAVASVWLAWRSSPPAHLRYAIFVTAIFLALPHVMIYDMTLCALPALWLMHRVWSGASDAWERLALVLLLLIPLPGMIGNIHNLPLVFVTMLFVHAVLCRALIRRPS